MGDDERRICLTTIKINKKSFYDLVFDYAKYIRNAECSAM